MPYQTKVGKLYIPCKRGDGIIAPGKPKSHRFFDGMCGGYIDPTDWDKPPVLSDYTMGETLWIEVDKDENLIQFVQDASAPYGGLPVNPSFRRNAYFIDFNTLAPFVDAQCPNFLTKVYQHKKKINVVKLDSISLVPAITQSKNINVNRKPIPDVGQITAGNYTVGPGAADNYPTFGGAGGGWAALGNLTGNLVFTLTGNITETATATCVNNLGAFTLLNTSSIPHYGDPAVGWVITHNFNGITFSIECESANGIFHIQYLQLIPTALLAANWGDILVQNVVTAVAINIHDMLVNKDGRGGSCVVINNNTPEVFLYNNVIWDVMVAGQSGILSSAANLNNIYENNIAYNCDTGINLTADTLACNNNAGFDNNTDFANIGGAVGFNNLSTDGSAADGNWVAGANNIINAAALACVQSVNDTQPNFMDILANGTFSGAGLANTIATRTRCIRNRTVPGQLGTSIGVAEIAPGFVGAQSRISIPLGMGIG